MQDFTPSKQQKHISAFASEMSSLADEALIKIGNRKAKNSVEKYLLGILERETVILDDLSFILERKPPRFTLSAFILSRVLMDDSINCLYLFNKDFDEKVVDAIDSDSWRYFFKTGKESYEFNNKFFNGSDESLITKEAYDKFLDEFIANDKNSKYNFTVTAESGGSKNIRFAGDISTHAKFEAIRDAEKGGINSHIYSLWRVYSQYIHHSNQTFSTQTRMGIREAEVNSLNLVVFYSAKTIVAALSYFLEEISSLGETVNKIEQVQDKYRSLP